MAVTATGSAVSPVIPQSTSPTKSRGLLLTANLTGVTVQPTTLVLVFGQASSAPATYSALAHPVLIDDVTGFITFQFADPGNLGIWSVRITDAYSLVSNADYSIGDHCWLCVFVGPTPAGSDVPVGVINCGLVVA